MKIKPVSAQASRDAWIMLACAVDVPKFRRYHYTAVKGSDGTCKRTSKHKPHVHQISCGHGYTPNDYVRVHYHEYTGHLQRAPTWKCLGSSPDEFKRFIWKWRRKYCD